MESRGSVPGIPAGRAAITKKHRNPHRASTACETCRLKKIRCDEGLPECTYCRRQGFRCDYQLRNNQKQDQLISRLLERLAHVEKKLERLSPSNGDKHQQREQLHEPANVPSIGDTAWSHSCDHSTVSLLANSSREENYEDSSQKTGPHRLSQPKELSWRLNQTTKSSTSRPFSREESRSPLPDVLVYTQPTSSTDIIPLVEYFFDTVCPLFPVICDQVSFKMASTIVAKGLQDDLPSCLVLLMIALSRAYNTSASLESGLGDFQRATEVLGRLAVEFTLEYAQAQLLAGLFVFKKGRLLSFWSYLHMSCTILYTMIKRDETSGIRRGQEEIKTTLRLYWISYNLERDMMHEVDDLPRTSLYTLEDRLPLPLGCDESGTIHMNMDVRTIYTFFLAEMSLKAIIARIHAARGSEQATHKSVTSNLQTPPLIQEFQTQLEEWRNSIPAFLGWSPDPGKGTCLPVGIRLKLLFWYAHFSLLKPLITQILHDPDHQLPFLGWTLLQNGLFAGTNMLKVTLVEKPDLDLILSNRLVSSILILREANLKGFSPALSEGSMDGVVQDCIKFIWGQVGFKSEWIACRLQTL